VCQGLVRQDARPICAVRDIGPRLAITLALPHRWQRSRFTKLAIGASGLMPNDFRIAGEI
jgi:hypothetical protein